MRFGFGRPTPDEVCYFDTPDAGGGGAPAGNSGATPAASPGTASTPPPASTAAPTTPGAGGGGKSAFTYPEDRSNWVPSHVLRERTEKARQQLEQAQRDLDYERRRVAALSGVEMPKPRLTQEQEQIRREFVELFPEYAALAKLDPAKLEKLTQMDFDALQRANQETSQRIWTNHGTQAVQYFADRIKGAYGADVAPTTMKRVLNAFAAECGENARMLQRYEAGDFSVIDEFMSDWTKGFIEPIRKTATQPTPGQIAARKLPRGGGGATVSAKPPSLKPSDGDKFHNAAFEAFQRSQG